MAIGVGIDTGSRTTRVVKLARRGSAIRWAGAVRHKPGAASEGELGAKLREASIRPRGGVAGLSGKDTILRYSRVPPAPAWKLRMLVGYDATQGGELAAAHGYRLLNLPATAESAELAVLSAVAKNDALEERLTSLARDGVRGVDFAPDALALYEIFRRCPEADEALDQYCLVLDVGAANTEMTIVYNRGLIFARSVSFGGADFTRALAETLDVERAAAERLKRKTGRILGEHEITAQPSTEQPMLRALAGVAEDFFGAVRASVMFARAQTKLVDLKIGRIYLSGAGVRIAGLAEFLADRFEARATAFRAPDDWGVPGEAGRSSEWMLALGLALMALDPPDERLSLLPPRARRRQTFRRRGVFAYAACALFVVAAAIGTAAHAHNWAAARSALAARKALAEDAAARDSKLAAQLARNEAVRERLARIRSALRGGARLARVLAFLHKTSPEPVALTSIDFRPGDLNGPTPTATLTLVGTIGSSPKGQRTVLIEFSDALKKSRWYAPPDPADTEIAKKAPDPKPGEPFRFRIEMPLRFEPEKEPARE